MSHIVEDCCHWQRPRDATVHSQECARAAGQHVCAQTGRHTWRAHALLPTMVEVQHTHDATGAQKHTVPRLWLLPALAAVNAGPLTDVRANQRNVLHHMRNTAFVLPESTAAHCTAG